MLAAVKDKPEEKVKNAATVSWFQQSVHRSRNEVFTEVKTITPGMAEVILSNNPENRRVRPIKFDQMVIDMKAGRWAFNGEPIIVAKTGELNDGQHRLAALVQAKVCLPMLFVFGVERETRTTLDQGATRSAGDYLSMKGVSNATTLGAIARYKIAYLRSDRSVLGQTNRITAAEILELAERDMTLIASTRYAMAHQKFRRYATGTVVGFCHNILLNEDVNDGLAFMEQLCIGENIQRGDPAFQARERLLALDTYSSATKIEVIFRAWNAYRDRRTMKVIPIHGRLPELR